MSEINFEIPNIEYAPAPTLEEESLTIEELANLTNRLRNPSFEDNARHPNHWRIGCGSGMGPVDRALKTRPEDAHDGSIFLECSAFRTNCREPARVVQELPQLSAGGTFRHVFSIHLRTRPVPGVRSVQLVLWQGVNVRDPDNFFWDKQVQTERIQVSREWRQYSVQVDGGAGFWKQPF